MIYGFTKPRKGAVCVAFIFVTIAYFIIYLIMYCDEMQFMI